MSIKFSGHSPSRFQTVDGRAQRAEKQLTIDQAYVRDNVPTNKQVRKINMGFFKIKIDPQGSSGTRQATQSNSGSTQESPSTASASVSSAVPQMARQDQATREINPQIQQQHTDGSREEFQKIFSEFADDNRLNFNVDSTDENLDTLKWRMKSLAQICLRNLDSLILTQDDLKNMKTKCVNYHSKNSEQTGLQRHDSVSSNISSISSLTEVTVRRLEI